MKIFKVVSSSVSAALLIGTLVRADVATDWNNAGTRRDPPRRHGPPIASRSLAILHVSIYNAVNGIARTHEAYLVQSAVPASASREAAASAAAHEALVNFSRMPQPHSMRFMPRFSLGFPTGHKRPQESCGVNSLPTKSSPRAPTMVPMP